MFMILHLAFRRVRAFLRREARIDQFALGESGPLSQQVILANRNYMNLLEMPILFYVVGVMAYAAGIEATWFVALAWTYVALRVLHSIVHVTYNHVLHRFALFAASNVVLVGMWLLLAIQLHARGS
ncbi:MAPEG family protein [Diaphorobacter aerolatus]|uniref:MAPEG family protein n=2 Tax=Diaphorobacter aerolatus TaxID=1288495 RepID=A0A7H0GQR1_9BURK|nr:MAPEG family protein [Diaphorobacter aerolatus]